MSDSKFLTGLVLGAIGGILLAPASGKETRGKISDVTADFRAKLSKKIDALKNEYKEKGELTMESVKDVLLNSGTESLTDNNLSDLEQKIKIKYKELEKEIEEMISDFKKNNSLT